MKKVLGVSLIAVFLSGFFGGTAAYADCNIKCITRNPFTGKCVFKTKVCSIGTPKEVVEQATNELGRFFTKIDTEWHNVYGKLPDQVRNVLNNNSFTIIGAYYGGLEGAALGQAIDRAIARALGRVQKTKEALEESPSWKDPVLLEGAAKVEKANLDIVVSGKVEKQYYVDQLDQLHSDFIECVVATDELPTAWRCLKTLDDALDELVFDARM